MSDLYSDLVNVISFTNWQPGKDRSELIIDGLILKEAEISYLARKCADYIEQASLSATPRRGNDLLERFRIENENMRRKLELSRDIIDRLEAEDKQLKNNMPDCCQLNIQQTERIEKLEELVKLQNDLLVCYRVQKQPSDRLLDRLYTLTKHEQALKG